MSQVFGFPPSMQIVDPRDGKPTRDMINIMQALVNALNELNGAPGSGTTLTNARIDGDDNTIVNVATSSLKNTSGDSLYVTTGRGTVGAVATWDANGNVGDGPVAATLMRSDDADQVYLRLDSPQPMVAPVKLLSTTVAGAPDPATYPAGLIYVSDESGGAVIAFSDGSDWLRATDRAVIS